MVIVIIYSTSFYGFSVVRDYDISKRLIYFPQGSALVWTGSGPDSGNRESSIKASAAQKGLAPVHMWSVSKRQKILGGRTTRGCIKSRGMRLDLDTQEQKNMNWQQ